MSLRKLGTQAAQGVANYTGAKIAPLNVVNFAGNGSAASEQQNAKSRNFKLKLRNQATTDQVIVLASIFALLEDTVKQNEMGLLPISFGFDSATLIPTEGDNNIGTEQTPVIFRVTSERGTLTSLLAYLGQNPSTLLQFRVGAKVISSGLVNEAQFNTTISRHIFNPFRKKNDVKEINLAQHFELNQFQSGLLDVKDGFTWGPNSFVTIPVLAGTEVTLDLQFGPVLSTERALEKMVTESGILVRNTAY